MRDPWQDETLDGLVAYLQAAREAGGTAWAVAVSSSEGLTAQLLEELGARVEELEDVDLSVGEDPRQVVAQRLSRAPDEQFRITVIRGFDEVLSTDAGEALLTWLNFHREDFERAAEAFVFVLPARHSGAWANSAPDLDRYTQHFELIDWEDSIGDANHRAGDLELEVFPLTEALLRAEQRLARSRGLYEREIKALVEVGLLEINLSRLQDAKRTVEEAHALTQEMATHSKPLFETKQRYTKAFQSSVKAYAALLSHTGQPYTALRELEDLHSTTDDEGLRMPIAAERFIVGEAHRALEDLEASTPDINELLAHRTNVATIGAWLGQTQMAIRSVQDAPNDFRPWMSRSQAYLLESHASLLVDTGVLLGALEPLARSLRLSLAVGSDQSRVAVLATLARATLDFGRPNRSLEFLADTSNSPGWQTARSYGLAIVRAEASWVISGPKGVLPVIRDERQRQHGWNAPIPAAEIAYVRALASVEDDEARRYLQRAADRFRAMDGWYYLSELERRLARLDRLQGDLDGAAARIEEGLKWHTREGLRPREARDRTELAMIALGRADPRAAHDSATQALELIHECGTRLHEPAALVALAAAEQALGRTEVAAAHERRWRRLITGIGGDGLRDALKRDATWACTFARL